MTNHNFSHWFLQIDNNFYSSFYNTDAIGNQYSN